MKSLDELRADLRGVEDRRARLFVERGNHSDVGHLADIDRGIAKLDTEKTDLEAEIGRVSEDRERRMEAIRAAAGDPRNTEPGGTHHDHSQHHQRRDNSPLGQARDEALRAIDRADLDAPAKDRIESIARRDTSGIDARYIAAHADPEYAEFFAAVITGRSQYELTPRQAEAGRMGLETQRAMSIGSPTAGGYGAPFTLDPTINNTSDGALNPLRSLATVKTITTSEWKGVSSAGVSAAFAAEGTEVADGTPTLGQPEIIPERAQVFVPFSWELGQDWGSLQAELVALFQDAKDTLEAAQFTTGRGHTTYNEPEGIITGATGTVAAGSAAFAVANLYTCQEALAPRYQPRASWLSSLTIKNAARRLVASADATEPQLFNDAGTELLGKPWHEVSDMTTTQTNGEKVFVYGDIAAGFTIVDRIGFTVSLIPHLMGGSGRPTGQSGLYGFFRTSSGVTNASALKVLETTA